MRPQPDLASAFLTANVLSHGTAPRRARKSKGAGRLHCSLLALAVFFLFLMQTSPIEGQHPGADNTQAPRPWDQDPDGMHIYIGAGLKSHYGGEHDYPQFLSDWSKI